METITRRVIKRNGEEVVFDVQKISNAIERLNNEVELIYRLMSTRLRLLARLLWIRFQSNHATAKKIFRIRAERGIMRRCVDMKLRRFTSLQKGKRDMARKANTTDDGILHLLIRS